ncbi:hypothetical protein BC831DRAFT_463500 [Entophlyctis helioformis]|nr:hypothetical protein BC831DRAFT_463500 [Entophlyctis helioformis]
MVVIAYLLCRYMPRRPLLARAIVLVMMATSLWSTIAMLVQKPPVLVSEASVPAADTGQVPVAGMRHGRGLQQQTVAAAGDGQAGERTRRHADTAGTAQLTHTSVGGNRDAVAVTATATAVDAGASSTPTTATAATAATAGTPINRRRLWKRI